MMVRSASSGPLLPSRREVLGDRTLGVPVVELGIAGLHLIGRHAGARDGTVALHRRDRGDADRDRRAGQSARWDHDRLAANAEIDRGQAPHEHRRRGHEQVRPGAEQAEGPDRKSGDRGHVERDPDVPEREAEGEQDRLDAGGADRTATSEEEKREREIAEETPRGDGNAEQHPVGAHQDGVAVHRRADVAEARVRPARRGELRVDVELHQRDRGRQRDQDPERPFEAVGARGGRL